MTLFHTMWSKLRNSKNKLLMTSHVNKGTFSINTLGPSQNNSNPLPLKCFKIFCVYCEKTEFRQGNF